MHGGLWWLPRVANGGDEFSAVMVCGGSGEDLRTLYNSIFPFLLTLSSLFQIFDVLEKTKWIEVIFYRKIPWASGNGFGPRPVFFGPEFGSLQRHLLDLR